jgi:hypothetical protein
MEVVMKSLRVLSVVLIVAAAGCGRKESPDESMDAERLKQMGEKAEVLVDSGKLCDPDKLRSLLPKTLPNMKRVGKLSSKVLGSVGKRYVCAEASFEGADGGCRVEITLTDAASARGLAAIPDSEWTTKDVKEDTDTKFIGVDTKDGRRVYREYNSTTQQGKIRVLVGDRFVAEVAGITMGFESIEALLANIPISALEKMASGK